MSKFIKVHVILNKNNEEIYYVNTSNICYLIPENNRTIIKLIYNQQDNTYLSVKESIDNILKQM